MFDLPAPIRQAVTAQLPEERLRYWLPAGAGGSTGASWCVVTEHHVVRVGKGRPVLTLISQRHFVAENLVGAGRLLVFRPDEPQEAQIVTTYPATHVPEYANLARALNMLAVGEEPKGVELQRDDSCPRCGQPLNPGTRVCRRCVNPSAALRRLIGMARPYRSALVGAFALFAVVTFLGVLVPQLQRILIDQYLVPRRQELRAILSLVAVIGLSYAGVALAEIIRGRLMARIGGGLSTDLRAMVYTKIQALSLSYLIKRETGDLLNRVSGDTGKIQRFIMFWGQEGISQGFYLVAVGAVLLASDWRLAALVILPIPLVLAASTAVWRWVRYLVRTERRSYDRVNSMLQDILSGIRVVKAFGRESWETTRFSGASRHLRDITTRNERSWNLIIPAMVFAMGIGELLVLGYGGARVLGRSLLFGELVQFTQYAVLLYGPLLWIGGLPRRFVDAMTAAERVFEVIDEPPEVLDRPHPVGLRIAGRIRFEGVSFGYRPHDPVLKQIDLEIQPGEMIGLVGRSGSGKSSLINLLLRLYDVQEGRILMDGVDLRDLALRDLRSQTGVVLQETFLFSGTVAQNIRYSKPDATRDEVIRAARIANAHDFIVTFPDGYDTMVGERGIRLSGGERQRVAIARAILHDPRVLILDEATSAVDTETEQQIQDALAQLVRNRTTIAIAHRLSTLRRADRLLVLDNGTVAEFGPHKELMQQRGIYFRLVQAQREMAQAPIVDG